MFVWNVNHWDHFTNIVFFGWLRLTTNLSSSYAYDIKFIFVSKSEPFNADVYIGLKMIKSHWFNTCRRFKITHFTSHSTDTDPYLILLEINA